jgi:hypothetical protein
MFARCVQWRRTHLVGRQVIDYPLLGVLTAAIWVMAGRTAGRIFACISVFLVISGVILHTAVIVSRRRSSR